MSWETSVDSVGCLVFFWSIHSCNIIRWCKYHYLLFNYELYLRWPEVIIPWRSMSSNWAPPPSRHLAPEASNVKECRHVTTSSGWLPLQKRLNDGNWCLLWTWNPSVCLSTCLSLSVFVWVYVCVCQSICFFICIVVLYCTSIVSVRLLHSSFDCLRVCLSVCLLVYLNVSAYLSASLSARLACLQPIFHLFLSVYLSVSRVSHAFFTCYFHFSNPYSILSFTQSLHSFILHSSTYSIRTNTMALNKFLLLFLGLGRLVLTIRRSRRTSCPKNVSCPSLSSFEAEMTNPLSHSTAQHHPPHQHQHHHLQQQQQQQPVYVRKGRVASVGDVPDHEDFRSGSGGVHFRTSGGTVNPGFRLSMDVARSLSLRGHGSTGASPGSGVGGQKRQDVDRRLKGSIHLLSFTFRY